MTGQRHQIIVVDENREFCQLMYDYLTRFDYDVVCFTSGKAALAHLREQSNRSVDLILTELHLRGMDPAEFFSALQSFEIPIIVVTSLDASSNDIEKGSVAGYLLKPFRLSEVAALIEKELFKRSQVGEAVK